MKHLLLAALLAVSTAQAAPPRHRRRHQPEPLMTKPTSILEGVIAASAERLACA